MRTGLIDSGRVPFACMRPASMAGRIRASIGGCPLMRPVQTSYTESKSASADASADRMSNTADDVIGKVYDSRLMGRLLKYLRPYKWQAGVSFVAILLKAASDVVGPFLFKVAIDNYLTAKRPEHPNWLARQLSPNPLAGITQLAGLYLAALLLTYLFRICSDLPHSVDGPEGHV